MLCVSLQIRFLLRNIARSCKHKLRFEWNGIGVGYCSKWLIVPLPPTAEKRGWLKPRVAPPIQPPTQSRDCNPVAPTHHHMTSQDFFYGLRLFSASRREVAPQYHMATSRRAPIGLTSLFPFTALALPSNTARTAGSVSPAVALWRKGCVCCSELCSC